MSVATFDTLKFANTLKAAGVPDKQAEAQAVAFAEVIQINLKDLVTKDDLKATADDLRREIEGVKKEFKQDIETVRQEFREVELRSNARLDNAVTQIRGELALLKWMIGVGLTMGTAILIRLFFFRGPL